MSAPNGGGESEPQFVWQLGVYGILAKGRQEPQSFEILRA